MHQHLMLERETCSLQFVACNINCVYIPLEVHGVMVAANERQLLNC